MKNFVVKGLVLLTVLLVAISTTALTASQETQTIQHPKTKENLKLAGAFLLPKVILERD